MQRNHDQSIYDSHEFRRLGVPKARRGFVRGIILADPIAQRVSLTSPRSIVLNLLNEPDPVRFAQNWDLIGRTESLRSYLLERVKINDRVFFSRYPRSTGRWRPQLPGEFYPFQPTDTRETFVQPHTTHQRFAIPADCRPFNPLQIWFQDDDGPQYDLLGPAYRQRPWERHDQTALAYNGKSLAELCAAHGDEVPTELRQVWLPEAARGKGVR